MLQEKTFHTGRAALGVAGAILEASQSYAKNSSTEESRRRMAEDIEIQRKQQAIAESLMNSAIGVALADLAEIVNAVSEIPEVYERLLGPILRDEPNQPGVLNTGDQDPDNKQFQSTRLSSSIDNLVVELRNSVRRMRRLAGRVDLPS